MTSEAATAFQELKGHFIEAPILRHFDPTQRIRVETDASAFTIGGILSQLLGSGTEVRWHPVAFYSRKLSPVERRYKVHDRELIAIVFAFKQWRQYLRGASDTVVVLTDHNNLKYFLTKRTLTGRQARWAESLAEFDFIIEYRTDKTNPADGPSRRPDHNVSEPNQSGDEDGCLPTLQAKLRLASLVDWGAVDKTGKRLSIRAVSIQRADARESQEAETHRLLAVLTYNSSESYENNIENRDDCVSYAMSTELGIRTILARDGSVESVSLSPGKKPGVEGVVLTESGGINDTGSRHLRTDEISEALVEY